MYWIISIGFIYGVFFITGVALWLNIQLQKPLMTIGLMIAMIGVSPLPWFLLGGR